VTWMFLMLAEISERGGDGGVVDTVVDPGFDRGGVDAVGDETVVADVDASDNGDRGRRLSMASACGFLWCCRSMFASACRNFSWTISASILRSESSSRSRCVSILKASRSCSPTLISSSSMTPLSIATLYLDSRSSSEEVVLRACRS